MATIEIHSIGGGNSNVLAARVCELADEFGNQVKISWTETRWASTYAPEALAIAAIVLTIIGWVATPIVTRLIDKLFERKEDTRNVTIQIIHQDSGVIFNLPSDTQKCIEHFRRLEENSEPPSSAAG